MTGGPFGVRTGSYGSLQQLPNVVPPIHTTPILVRKASRKPLTPSKEKERFCPSICRYIGREKVAMLLMVAIALIVFITDSLAIIKESTVGKGYLPSRGHRCDNFAFPPPPPADRKRTGPRPCSVCYVAPEEAIASMPSLPSLSPVLRTLTYVHDENPNKTEPNGGSDFGGFPSLEDRNAAFDIKEKMTVHCGFVKGSRPGHKTGFDIDDADLLELDQYYDVIVASAIFGNYDVLQQPKNISEEAKKDVPFYMFIDEETEKYMKNAGVLGNSKRVGLWRIIVVRNVPYTDSRRNGKVPKLLLHRIIPNVRYSIWIDAKLQLVVDPYQILERFLWRTNATFAISRHYRRFDVFAEAEANKAAGKYENASIDYQIQFYQAYDGLTHYSRAKLPITSDVPEGCVIIREHIPITNLFTCLWFNEVDRFTSRDQLSFSTVRDKIMAKVDWSINMFLDCERRNFVLQAYHRELLEHMLVNLPPPPPPPPPAIPQISLRWKRILGVVEEIGDQVQSVIIE